MDMEKESRVTLGQNLTIVAHSIDEGQQARFGKSLCSRCCHSVISRRKGRLEPVTYCTEMHRNIPNDIDECNRFELPNKMDVYDMAKIAELIDPRQGIHDDAYR